MSFNMLVKSAVLCLKANKIRVFLTMIGIIIGISTEVVILSIGAGLQQNVSKSVSNTDVNTLGVQFQSKTMTTNTNITPFQESDFKQLERIDGVLEVKTDDGGLMGFLVLGDKVLTLIKVLI